VVLYASGEVVNATARTQSLSHPVNGRVEHLQVRIRVNGLWSVYSSVKITVSFTPPATPTLGTIPDQQFLRITVLVVNPTPAGSQPVVERNEVSRRQVGTTLVERLSTTVASNGQVIDRTPGVGGQVYEYRALAVGVNGTTAEGAWTL
jgi:hypothetical protein